MIDPRISTATSPALWAALSLVIPLALAGLAGGLAHTAFPRLLLAVDAIPILITLGLVIWHLVGRRRVVVSLLAVFLVLPAVTLWTVSVRRFAFDEAMALRASKIDQPMHDTAGPHGTVKKAQ